MNKLDEIMASKRREIAPRLRPVRDRELAVFANRGCGGPGLAEALKLPARMAVISEIKRRSPSAGEIADGTEAAEQARIYYNAGCDAISVLTDEKYFSGSLRDLWEVTDFLNSRDNSPPTLRKDFMVHPIQVVEAAEAGARAILIIVRALDDDEISVLRHAADLAALDCLYEVHEEKELDRALQSDARIVGVNNRDLTRFVTDLAISERLVPQIPDDIVKVSESGITTVDDAARVRDAGADAVLVGEALMRSDDPDALIADFQSC